MLEGSFFTILSQNIAAESADFNLHIHPEHPIFSGHFPGDAVTPGVCIIQMACDLFEKVQGSSFIISELKNAKFIHIIRPKEVSEVRFHLEWNQGENRQYALKCMVSDSTTTFAKIQFSITSDR